MKRVILGLSACWLIYGQASIPPLSFEVAAIKPSQSPDGDVLCSGGPGTRTPGQYTCGNTTVADMVRFAFGVRSYQVSYRGPQTPAFEVTAKVPAGTTSREQCRIMLQNLLVERFRLAYHYEKRDLDGYELSVAGKGPKLMERPRESALAAGNPGPATSRSAGKPALGRDGFLVLPPESGQILTSTSANGAMRWTFNDAPLKPLVDYLIMILGRPVTDRTGLQGRYDITLTFMNPRAAGRAGSLASAPDGGLATANEIEPAPSIFAALDQQLGLKLDPKKVTLDVVVIDRAERTPTEN